jgi:hypothetical protein
LAYCIDDGVLAKTMTELFFDYQNWADGWKWKDWTYQVTVFCYQVTVVTHSIFTLLGMRLFLLKYI